MRVVHMIMSSPSCLLKCLKAALITTLVASLFSILVILNSAELRYYPPKNDPFNAEEIKKIAIMAEGAAPSDKLLWTTEVPQLISQDDKFFTEGRYVTTNFSFSPGLGNLMFQYASMLGMGRLNNATLLTPDRLLLRRAFSLNSSAVVEFRLWTNLARKWPRFTARDCCRYYRQTEQLNSSQQMVMGYLQSFRYFHHVRSEILREFQFLPEINRLAQEALRKALEGRNAEVLVGVHVRRGIDMTWNLRNMEHGHTVATLDYFLNAMSYLRKKYSGKKLAFVVATDDTYWSRTKLISTSPDVTMVATKLREVDMAALTLCNHTVMSQGTYSWWLAYLTGGDTIYYQDWPRVGSRLDEMLNREDFYPPDWIPMR